MKILVVKLSSIGDVVHTLPAVAAIRRRLPHARISWVVDARASAILKDSPVIDQLIEVDSTRLRKGLFDRQTRKEARLHLRQLRGDLGQDRNSGPGSGSRNESSARPDIAIDFQGLVKSGLIAFLSGAERRIGFASYDLREKASRYLLTDQVPTASALHVIDKNLELAESIWSGMGTELACNDKGGSARERRYEFPISVSDADLQYVDELITGSPRAAIINPGGGWVTKLWRVERYGELADWLWKECDIKSFVTYGPGEEALAHGVASTSRSGVCRALPCTLKQFAGLARRAILFVGGDTGPLHLAAAAGTPIVGLYGPTSPERNGPFSKSDITVGRDLWCRVGCYRRKCWHWECMEIPIDEVKRAIRERLSRPNAVAAAPAGISAFPV
jgi:ADP-heptose:LPS heptosyltransferase